MREINLQHDDVMALDEERPVWRNYVADLWTTWGPEKIKWVVIEDWKIFLNFTRITIKQLFIVLHDKLVFLMLNC